MNLNEFKEIVTKAGIVGAGGAGFPTAVKYTQDATTLIINAAECEPLIYTDYYILKREMDKVVGAASLIIDVCEMDKGYLSLKQHTAERLTLTDGQQLADKLFVKVLPNVYPMGDEIVLIYETVHKVITPGSLPISAGVIVNNVETLYNIYNAVYGGQPVTEKWVTIGGKVQNNCVIKAYIGTPVSAVLDEVGVTVPEDCVLIDGGPAMGNIINPGSAKITKTTKSLLVLPKNIPAITVKLTDTDVARRRGTSACCSCSRCSDLCPRHLLGYSLEPHKVMRASNANQIDPQLFANAMQCCQCGVCEVVACCHELSPKKVYGYIKGLLAKEGIKYVHDGSAVVPNSNREYRLLPSDRFMQMLGVDKFDKGVPEYKGLLSIVPKSITLSLKQHVGAPAAPNVSTGDFVCAGDIVGKAQGVISANIHTSIDGKVLKADDKEIIIG